MKKSLIVYFLALSLLCMIAPAFATSTQSEAAMAKVREIIGSLEWYGAITTDVGEWMKRTYNEKIVQNASAPDIVITEADTWARQSLRETLTKKLTSLKDREYLTEEQFKKYQTDYETIIVSEVNTRLGTVYKSYLRFEEEIIANGVNVVRDAMYKKIITTIKTLFNERKITEEKMNSWIVIIDRKIYEYKSDPNVVMQEVIDEAKNYTTVLVQSGAIRVIDSISDKYYDAVKKTQYKRLEKLSLKNLKTQFNRAKKTLSRQKEWTIWYKKQSALVRLLEEIIAAKEAIIQQPSLKK